MSDVPAPMPVHRLLQPRAAWSAALAVLVGYCLAVLLAGPERQALVAPLLGVVVQAACGAALLVGLRSSSSTLTRVWWLCGVSALASAGVLTTWAWYAARYGGMPPVLSLADLFYVSSVVLSLAAALAWPAAGGRRGDRGRYLLDGALVTAALLLLVLPHSVGPGSVAQGGSWSALVPLVYPALDLLAVAAAAYAVARSGRDTRRAALLLLTGVSLLAVGDAAFAVLSNAGSWNGDLWVMALWMAAFLLLALSRTVASEPSTREEEVPSLTNGRITVALPVLPVTAGLVAAIARPTDLGTVVVGSTLVLLLMTRYAVLALGDRKLVEDLYAERQVLLHQILESLPDGVLTCDPRGAITFCNAAATRLTGLPPIAPGPTETTATLQGLFDGPDRDVVTTALLQRAEPGQRQC